MAPRGASSWRRPHTSIYNDNYKYGENLYSGTLDDIQKKYHDSMSKTQLRSDRPDMGLSTFSSSNLGSSPTPIAVETSHFSPSVSALLNSPTRDTTSTFHGSVFESMLNSALHSSYAVDSNEEKKSTTVQSTDGTNVTSSVTVEPTRPASRTSEVPPRPTVRIAETSPQRPISLYDDAGLFTPARKNIETSDLDEKSSSRRKKTVKETTVTITQPQNGPTHDSAYYKDKCRDLQSQVDILTQAMSDVSTKLKGELTIMKGKLGSEIGDLHATLEQSSVQSNDLQKTVKKQANQLMELQTSYEDLQRHLQDSLEEVGGWQRRNQTLRKEMDRLRTEVEETLQKGSATRA